MSQLRRLQEFEDARLLFLTACMVKPVHVCNSLCLEVHMLLTMTLDWCAQSDVYLKGSELLQWVNPKSTTENCTQHRPSLNTCRINFFLHCLYIAIYLDINVSHIAS